MEMSFLVANVLPVVQMNALNGFFASNRNTNQVLLQFLLHSLTMTSMFLKVLTFVNVMYNYFTKDFVNIFPLVILGIMLFPSMATTHFDLTTTGCIFLDMIMIKILYTKFLLIHGNKVLSNLEKLKKDQ